MALEHSADRILAGIPTERAKLKYTNIATSLQQGAPWKDANKLLAYFYSQMTELSQGAQDLVRAGIDSHLKEGPNNATPHAWNQFVGKLYDLNNQIKCSRHLNS